MCPKGKPLASAAHDELTIRIWDSASCLSARELKGHCDWIHSMPFSPNGLLLASCSNDETIRIWDTLSGGLVRLLCGHEKGIRAVTFSADGTHLASASDDKTVRIWNLTLELDNGPDGQKTVMTACGYSELARAVAFSPDGAMLATSSDDLTIILWRLDLCSDPQVIRVLRGHRISVRAVSFSPPSGHLLASASPDGDVKIWDTTTGAILQSLRIRAYINSITFSPQGPYLRTNRGLLPIGHYNPDSGEPQSADVFLDGDWITRRGERLLWLPLRFRSTSSSYWRNVFFLGHSSGFVTSMEFDLTCP
ncbi:WD40-repeat-containing domain protein [Lasiosphaeria miniovina]|uniref:WD40-repeat-containing domain protein n=1 Tax=Lasiosphaeria miniovina TaxID=1954250 RepID=A0AA40E9M0_9PEZI|nr:WD40-repeat-containing domain protein [Lasiosphaeria miniovina]KAK0727458.1 WD40-repeat-containing domain protein [Lasiosphaeria miniovina]